jgi:xanthine dehydrogenase small subunit
LTLNRKSGTVDNARLVFNRVRTKIPERALETEKILVGNSLTEFKLSEACETLERELSLTSDFRASAEYRMKVAKNLLRESLRHCKQCIEQEGKSAA